MGGHGTIEVAKTVLEVADVAWKAMETHQHHKNHENKSTNPASSEEELESLRSENQRLRNLLEQNLKLLQNLSESPSLLHDCPPDVRLYYFQPHFFLSFFICIICVILSFAVEFCGIPHVGLYGIEESC